MDRWYRVNKKQPCAICRRPDWCTYADGVGCCMRVKSETEMRNGGYLHRTRDPIPYVQPIRKAIEDKPLEAKPMWERWFNSTDYHLLERSRDGARR